MQVEFKKVNKFYSDLHVIRDLDLTIPSGEKVVLIGPSGCGKSTLLFCINGLEHIKSGEILVDGVSINHCKRKELRHIRQKIGIVFQQFNLFPHFTVRENVELALKVVLHLNPKEIAQRSEKVLGEVGLADKMNHYLTQLSGGQQQRVALARALVMEPEILLLDEITSALDPELTGEVLEVVEKLAHERAITLVFVTHEILFSRKIADRIIFMENGVIVEQGPPDQVLMNPCEDRTRQFLCKVTQHIDGAGLE